MKSRILLGIAALVSLGMATGNAQPYYNPDIQGIIDLYGCANCHGGASGLFVTPYSNILTTGDHGPVVVPFDSNSVIIKKLKGTAGFGLRMPRNGPPFLTDSEIQVFVQWVMNGALESAATSVAHNEGTPATFELAQNYPNPFNPTTSIRFQVPEAADVRLAVYDRLGREVAVIVDGRMDAGRHETSFDATGLASGVYLYKLQARSTGSPTGPDGVRGSGSFVQTRKMIVVK
jgi:hypothetical protein